MSEIDSVHPDSGYRLICLIAEGSRSRVYLAEDSSQAGRQVAVKFLRQDLFGDNAEAAKHLSHEANCLALSAHNNVLARLNSGENTEGRSYLVCEHLTGISLKQLLAEAPLDPPAIINILLPLTNALENMHKIGVLHLDLRPDKIIVERTKKNPTSKIIGFGRAKFLPWAGREQPVEPPIKSGLYSLQYASPEQAMEKRCLPTSDVYSLGCILYEAIAGRPPIQGENELHIMAQHLSGKVQPPSVVKQDNNLRKYDEVVMQALAAETHRRFVDAAEFRDALVRVNPTGWMARLFRK
jgi:eukaryotic-like serine/threonine-protein kinase